MGSNEKKQYQRRVVWDTGAIMRRAYQRDGVRWTFLLWLCVVVPCLFGLAQSHDHGNHHPNNGPAATSSSDAPRNPQEEIRELNGHRRHRSHRRSNSLDTNTKNAAVEERFHTSGIRNPFWKNPVDQDKITNPNNNGGASNSYNYKWWENINWDFLAFLTEQARIENPRLRDPSTGPSSSSSVSQAPSVIPSTSQSPSEGVTLSQAPSGTPSESARPTLSQAPSSTPSTDASTSEPPPTDASSDGNETSTSGPPSESASPTLSQAPSGTPSTEPSRDENESDTSESPSESIITLSPAPSSTPSTEPFSDGNETSTGESPSKSITLSPSGVPSKRPSDPPVGGGSGGGIQLYAPFICGSSYENAQQQCSDINLPPCEGGLNATNQPCHQRCGGAEEGDPSWCSEDEGCFTFVNGCLCPTADECIGVYPNTTSGENDGEDGSSPGPGTGPGTGPGGPINAYAPAICGTSFGDAQSKCSDIELPPCDSLFPTNEPCHRRCDLNDGRDETWCAEDEDCFTFVSDCLCSLISDCDDVYSADNDDANGPGGTVGGGGNGTQGYAPFICGTTYEDAKQKCSDTTLPPCIGGKNATNEPCHQRYGVVDGRDPTWCTGEDEGCFPFVSECLCPTLSECNDVYR